ncbi:hypothetical protein [Streptomyces sp. NPDC057253]|uniref:hypothetical protein n=1 Tax=Streptomyces sp. NPDC057253 TaxID=3346069 RepID=UPI0036274BB4
MQIGTCRRVFWDEPSALRQPLALQFLELGRSVGCCFSTDFARSWRKALVFADPNSGTNGADQAEQLVVFFVFGCQCASPRGYLRTPPPL